MNWVEDSLDYGYVIDRVDGGGWWHMHFGRSTWSYHCDLLGCQTNVLACIQWFAPWAVAESPRFLLTLDGERVELPAVEIGLDCRWGQQPNDPELAAEALHFQREVMTLLLFDSTTFRRAVAKLVSSH